MMQIRCPYCGDRDEREFRCAGEAHVARPAPPDAASDARWAEYLYFQRNPRGMNRERWCHVLGCRQWFNVARDTVTHAVLKVYPMGESGTED